MSNDSGGRDRSDAACHRIRSSYGDIGELEKKLRTKSFAAFIVEPVQAEGGVLIPPPDYLLKARGLSGATDGFRAGWAALTQKDWKFVIGYSSVSHMGYVLLGIATLNVVGVSGAVLLMFAHGVMAALTFALIGFFYHQTHNRFVPDLSGLARKIPFIGVCMVMAVMASSGLPGFANFASEVLVFLGSWQQGSTLFRVATICAVWGIVVTATYLLWAVRTSFFGPFDEKWSMLKDAVTFKQKFPYALLLAVLLTVGFYPRLLTDIIKQSVATSIVSRLSTGNEANAASTDTADNGGTTP